MSATHIETQHTFALKVHEHTTYLVEANSSRVRVKHPHIEEALLFSRRDGEFREFIRSLAMIADKLDELNTPEPHILDSAVKSVPVETPKADSP
jgi:hypothetical protein